MKEGKSKGNGRSLRASLKFLDDVIGSRVPIGAARVNAANFTGEVGNKDRLIRLAGPNAGSTLKFLENLECDSSIHAAAHVMLYVQCTQ